MISAQVVSPVIGEGTQQNPYRARIVDIPGALVISDNTAGNPPLLPNGAVFTCNFSPEAFAAVEADSENYLVVWSVDNG